MTNHTFLWHLSRVEETAEPQPALEYDGNAEETIMREQPDSECLDRLSIQATGSYSTKAARDPTLDESQDHAETYHTPGKIAMLWATGSYITEARFDPTRDEPTDE